MSYDEFDCMGSHLVSITLSRHAAGSGKVEVRVSGCDGVTGTPGDLAKELRELGREFLHAADVLEAEAQGLLGNHG